MSNEKGRNRRILVGLSIVVVVAAGAIGLWLWRSYGFLLKLRPPTGFSQADLPAPPDYGREAMWAALPTTADEADLVPAAPGLEDVQLDAPADVFFIHPTSFLRPQWNDPIDVDSRAREGVERFIAGDASLFNGCCRVYAPVYRQATFFAFVTTSDDGPRALQVAYDDVRRAFQAFIDRVGPERPFIVASHSQGTLHAYRLLRDEIDSTPLRARLVAAYALGYSLPVDRFERDYDNIGVCDSPDDTGCLITWETWAKGTKPEWTFYVWDGDRVVRQAEAQRTVCVNPLSWAANEVMADAALHLGAIVLPPLPTRDHFIRSAEHSGMKYERLDGPHGHRTSAQCTARALWVESLPSPPFRSMIVKGNYHLHDFLLFYLNIRENAQRRVRAWLAAHTKAEQG